MFKRMALLKPVEPVEIVESVEPVIDVIEAVDITKTSETVQSTDTSEIEIEQPYSLLSMLAVSKPKNRARKPIPISDSQINLFDILGHTA